MKLFSLRLSIFTLVFAVLVSLSGFAQDAAQVLELSLPPAATLAQFWQSAQAAWAARWLR